MEYEYFIDVKGYKGLYRCSNFGMIISFKTGRPVCTSVNKNGYKTGCLYKYGVRREIGNAGVIILESFYPRPAPKNRNVSTKPIFECAHLDGNPSNNHISNLVWATSELNMSHKKI